MNRNLNENDEAEYSDTGRTGPNVLVILIVLFLLVGGVALCIAVFVFGLSADDTLRHVEPIRLVTPKNG